MSSSTDEAIARIARIAAEVNHNTENIGARSLHTILEKLLEDLSFEAPELSLEHYDDYAGICPGEARQYCEKSRFESIYT